MIVEQLVSKIAIDGVSQYEAGMGKVQATSERTGKAMLTVAGGLAAVGTAGTLFTKGAIQSSSLMERQAKTLEVLGGSASYASGELDRLDKRAAFSAFDLTELVGASKLLKAFKLESASWLSTVENLAAGMNRPLEEVADSLGRLRSGQFGEAFESLRRFGISVDDLKQKGLQFTKQNEYTGDSMTALAAVAKLVEERFGGMSEKIARTTTSGAISNWTDAWGRLQRKAGGQVLPQIREGIIKATDALSGFTDGMSPATATAIALLGPLTAMAAPLATGAALMTQWRSATVMAAAAQTMAAASTTATTAAVGAQSIVLLRAAKAWGTLAMAAAGAFAIKTLSDQSDTTTPKGYAGKMGGYTAGGALMGSPFGLPGVGIGATLGFGYGMWDEWQGINAERDRANKSGSEADARREALRKGGKGWLRSEFGGKTPRESMMASNSPADTGSFSDVIDAFRLSLLGGIKSGALASMPAMEATDTQAVERASMLKYLAMITENTRPIMDFARQAFGGGSLGRQGISAVELRSFRGGVAAGGNNITIQVYGSGQEQVTDAILSLRRRGII